MQKRQSLILDDAYYDFSFSGMEKTYQEESFRQNRADSIWWARQRYADNLEIRDYLMGLRQLFQARLRKEFPREAALASILDTDEDINHFLVFIGQFADKEYTPALQNMARFFCEQLKSELNLDLHPMLFRAERPHNPRRPRKTIRIP